MVTDLRGQPWMLGTDNIVVSNGAVHDKLLALFAGARPG